MRISKYFYSSIPIKMTKSQISDILKNPTKIKKGTSVQTTESYLPDKKTQPDTLFDLNKAKIDDMIHLYNQTKDIELVNKTFGVQLKSFKYGLPIPNIDP